MDELKQKIIGLLEGAGGTMLYADLLANIDGLERLSLARTLAVMADEKALHQTVTWDAEAGAITHEVSAGAKVVADGNSV